MRYHKLTGLLCGSVSGRHKVFAFLGVSSSSALASLDCFLRKSLSQLPVLNATAFHASSALNRQKSVKEKITSVYKSIRKTRAHYPTSTLNLAKTSGSKVKPQPISLFRASRHLCALSTTLWTRLRTSRLQGRSRESVSMLS